MNIQIDDEVEIIKKGKRKTIKIKQINGLDGKIQPSKEQDIQIKQQKLSIVLNQCSMKDVEDLNQRLSILIEKNQNFEQLVVINALNFVMQKKFIIKNLKDLNKLKLKKINYYQMTIHPVGFVLKVILLLLQQLDNNFIEEINIIIAPCLKLSQNELTRKKNGKPQDSDIVMKKLTKARIKIQNQFFSEFEIKWLSFLLKTLSKSEELKLLSIDLSKCKFESEEFNKFLFDLSFSQFKKLQSLSLNVHQIEKIKEITLSQNVIENLECLSISFASIYLDSKCFSQLLTLIQMQQQLAYLDLNLTQCTLDTKKLEQLIFVLLDKTKLTTLMLDLSENIFCQTMNHIPFQNNEQRKCNLTNLSLKLNQCVWLCDQAVQPSPDFFLLTAFNFQHLCLDLSGTKLDYDSLDTLVKELAISSCKALTIQLNNTRINFEQVIFFSRALSNCQDVLYLDVSLKNNQFDQTQIDLILAAFIQMQLMQLNIYFDIEISSKLVTNYALNNFCLLKSNLVNKQMQKVLHTRRILIYLMHKLEKFNIKLNIIQFLYDLWI